MHTTVNLFLIKSGYYNVPSPSTALSNKLKSILVKEMFLAFSDQKSPLNTNPT